MNHHQAESVPAGSFLTSRAFALTSLVVANLAAIFFFVVSDASILQVIWIYWLQSVIIGAVNVVRILKLDFSRPVPQVDGAPVPPAPSAGWGAFIKVFLAGFFIMHYGGFHFAYLVFLVIFTLEDTFTFNGVEQQFSLGEVSAVAVLLSGFAFAVHHVISFIDERMEVRRNPHAGAVSTGRAMVQPYLRILPMHLTIIMGPIISLKLGNTWVFVAFMILKTMADVRLYQIGTSHKAAQPTPAAPPAV